MTMYAMVKVVGESSLLVYDFNTSQEVIVHTPNACFFIVGEEIFIKYSGAMTKYSHKFQQTVFQKYNVYIKIMSLFK